MNAFSRITRSALVLLACLLAVSPASAAEVSFGSFEVVGNSVSVETPFESNAGTLGDPDTVTIRIGAKADTFNFRLNVVGTGFLTNGSCDLDWEDGFGAPEDETISYRAQRFEATQDFSVSKTALGVPNGGTQTVRYKLEVSQVGNVANEVERHIAVTFVADSVSEKSLYADPAILDANRNTNFDRDVRILSTSSGTISALTINETSWNDLKLEVSQSDRKIRISGKPKTSGSRTFVVGGNLDDVAAESATFTIRVSDVPTYSLTATPDFLTPTRGQYFQSTVNISSNTGKKPTNLSTDIKSWRGLEISVSNNDSLITVSGRPSRSGMQVVTVSGRVDGNTAVSTTFTIDVYSSGDDDDDDDDGGSCNSVMNGWYLFAAVPLFFRRWRG